MKRSEMMDVASILGEQDKRIFKSEMNNQGTGMSDREFMMLKSEIRQAMEKLEMLQKKYHTETGQEFHPFR